MDNSHTWASGSSSQFGSMSLLNMLAEVATEKLYTDPTVQMLSAPKITEPVKDCLNVEPVTKSENNEKSLVNEGKPLTLLQVSKMSDINLLKYFSINQANEIKKKFYYTCRLLPATCEQMTQSFGNEEKARNLMKKHLRGHLRALLQVNNTCTSQENCVLRSVVKQKIPLSNSELFSKRKGSKIEPKSKTMLSEKENSANAASPSFILKPSKSYGSTKEKETKYALKIIRPNSSSSDATVRKLNQTNLSMGKLLINDHNSMIRKTVNVFGNAADNISVELQALNTFVVENREYRGQLPISNKTQSVIDQNLVSLEQVAIKENVTVNFKESADAHLSSPSNSICHYFNSPDTLESLTDANNSVSRLHAATETNLQAFNQIDVVPQIQIIANLDKNTSSFSHIEDLFSPQLSTKTNESFISKPETGFLKNLHCKDRAFDRTLNDCVTVSHDHGYVGGSKATISKSGNSEMGMNVLCLPDKLITDSKLFKSEEFSVSLIKKEDTLLNQHMAIELQGEIMVHDLTSCGAVAEKNSVNDKEGFYSKNQITPLPVVGSEVEFKPDIKYIDFDVDDDQMELSDSLENDFSYIKMEDEKDSIFKKQRKGKGKFIGQSKAEKEMALELINQIKSQSVMVVETLECNICDPPRIFTAPSTLISHYKSHAGICPYVCSLCQAVFTRQHSLNYHMLIHSNQTRFTCDDCGRKFRHPSHFKEHRRRHTGESPFSCMDCSMKFKTRNTYKRHLRTRHGKVLTTQGQVQYIYDDHNSEGTVEIKTEDDSIISCEPFIKQEIDLGELSFKNEESEVKVLNGLNISSYVKNDQPDQSSYCNPDYNNILHHLAPDISIIAVDKSVKISNTSNPNSNTTSPGVVRNRVVVSNNFDKLMNVRDYSERPKFITNQETNYLYDISISPAEPTKHMVENLSVKKSTNNPIPIITNGYQYDARPSALISTNGNLLSNVDDSAGNFNVCKVSESASVVGKSLNSKDERTLQSHSFFDFSSVYHKDTVNSAEISNMNSATLVNTIESVVNMEFNGISRPLQPNYSSQTSEIRDMKYFVEQPASCNSFAHGSGLSRSDSSCFISNEGGHNTHNDAVRATSDKWTNLLKEVISLSSAVSNKGKQELSTDISILKPSFQTDLKKVPVVIDSYSDQDSIAHSPVSRVKESSKNKTVVCAISENVAQPTNQFHQKNRTSEDDHQENYKRSSCSRKRNRNSDEDRYHPNDNLTTALENGTSSVDSSFDCQVETIHPKQITYSSTLDKNKATFMIEKPAQLLCKDELQSRNVIHIQSPNQLEMSENLCFSNAEAHTEVEDSHLFSLNSNINEVPLVQAHAQELYLIKCIKKPIGHLTKIFKADTSVYINDSDKNPIGILSNNHRFSSDLQCLQPVSENSSKSKHVIVTTSKPIKYASEASTAQVVTVAQKPNSAPVHLSSNSKFFNSGKVLIQSNQTYYRSKKNNVMLLGTNETHSATESFKSSNNVAVVQKNSVSNVKSYIKIPVMSSAVSNNSVVHNFLIPTSTSNSVVYPSNCSVINSSFVPLPVTSSCASVILNSNVISNASEKSAPLRTGGTKDTTSHSCTTPSVNSNVITIYPSNGVFHNSSSIQNVDTEALTLNFSDVESKHSNIFILNSGNGGNLSLNSTSKSVVLDTRKPTINPDRFAVQPSSNGSTKVDLEYSKSNAVTSTTSYLIPTCSNTSIIRSLPVSSTSGLSFSYANQNSAATNTNITSQTNVVHQVNDSINIREPLPTGILSHLLSSGKSISSGSFYYSNYDGILKNGRSVK